MDAHTPKVKIVKSADGLDIYAEAVGDHSKPHVVFLHGFAFSAMVWDVQFSSPEILQHIYAVRVDLRGHGRSGKAEERQAWVSRRLAEDFDAVVKAFELKRPILAGWSFGATIATDVVNAFGPGYLSGIIYVGAMGYTPDEGNFLSLQDDPLCAKMQDLTLSPEENRQLLTAFLNESIKYSKALPVQTREAWFELMLSQPYRTRRYATSRTQDKFRFWATAGPVLPILVVHGKLDAFCPYNVTIDEVKTRFKNFEIECWDEGGHMTFLERPKEFNAAILRWVHKILS